MSYSIEALVCSGKIKGELIRDFSVIDLPQGYIIIPLVDALKELRKIYPEHQDGENDEMRPGFGKAPPSILPLMKKLSLTTPIAYIESERFGGHGDDFGIPWCNGSKICHEDFVSLNESLAIIGVITGNHTDEFEALRLGKYRSTEKWISEPQP